MSGDQSDLLSKISKDISALRHLKEMELKDLIVREVERVASTPARKKMWFLSDGTLGTMDIAGKVGVNVRSVQRFLQDATKAGLIILDKRGQATRALDWAPLEWSEILPEQETNEGVDTKVQSKEEAE